MATVETSKEVTVDGLRHPVGDQPSNVYWKRRVAVLAGVVVAVLLVWWILSSLTGGSASPGTAKSPGPTVSPSTSPSSTLALDRACTDADVEVTTGPKDAGFGTNEMPTFDVTVTSVGSSACMVDPKATSTIVIASGNDTWFDSSTCKDYAVFDAEKFLIQPGDKHELTASWNRGRGDKGCSADLQPATKGYFWVTTTVGGVSADKLQFHIG